MAEMTYAEERQRCKRCYEKWDFVRRIVALYEEGVSWKGCKVIAPADPDIIGSKYSEVIGVDAIKKGVRGMLVEGVGEFDVQIGGHPCRLSILALRRSPLEAQGQPFLWPYIQNDQALEGIFGGIGRSREVEWMVGLLMDDMCRGLGVPRQLLRDVVPDNAGSIMDGLVRFRCNVGAWRSHVSSQLTEQAGPLVCKALDYEGCVKVVWNEEWLPGSIGGYGQVYRVFKAQGIELKGLAEQVLKQASGLYKASMISRERYEEWVRWFLEC